MQISFHEVRVEIDSDAAPAERGTTWLNLRIWEHGQEHGHTIVLFPPGNDRHTLLLFLRDQIDKELKRLMGDVPLPEHTYPYPYDSEEWT